MSIERIFYCDWRECESHVRAASARPQASFMTITESMGPTLHFCSWDCILKHAAEKPLAEVVAFGES
jgi:hypothetical protein